MHGASRSLSIFLWSFVTATLIFLVYRHPIFVTSGLDPSWMYASEYAYRNSLVFGRDFSFTSGPLSFVYTGLFSADTYWIVFLGLIITALSFLCVVWFSISPAFSVIPLALAALAFAPLSEDAALYLTPFAAFLCALTRVVPRSL